MLLENTCHVSEAVLVCTDSVVPHLDVIFDGGKCVTEPVDINRYFQDPSGFCRKEILHPLSFWGWCKWSPSAWECNVVLYLLSTGMSSGWLDHFRASSLVPSSTLILAQ